MTPKYEISIADKIIDFGGRLVSLQIKQERERWQGMASDCLEIVLEDTKSPRLAIPPLGDPMRVRIGYEGQPLVDKGIYIVDETELNGPPNTMVIRAQNNPKTPKSDEYSPLNTQKERSWQEPLTVQTLINQIAKDHGLTPRVSPSLASFPLPHIDQTDMTDLEIIERYVCKPFDAYSIVVNGSLVVVGDGLGKSVNGLEIPNIVAWAAQAGEVMDPAKTYLTSWRARFTEYIRYNTAVAKWFNRDTAETVEEKIGSGDDPVLRLTWQFPTKFFARKAAEGALKRCRRATGEIEASFPGVPTMISGGVLQLKNVHPELENTWYCKSVVHTIDASGFWTQVNGERLQTDYLAEEEMGLPSLAH